MFNEEFKNRFLNESTLSESTKSIYQYIFKKTEGTEEILQKDIYEMNPYECDQLIYVFPRKSIDVITVTISCLKRYVDFCKDNNYVKNFFNYFSNIQDMTSIRKYLDVTAMENKYITLEELRECQEYCENFQDKVIAELLFIGIKGEELIDLINLKVKDVSYDKIILPDREILINEKTYEVIKGAIDETTYSKVNFAMSNLRASELMINPTEYVLRTAGSKKFGQLNYNSLLMRIQRLKKLFGKPYLNASNIWMSGMLHKLKEIKNIKGELIREDYQEICVLFGFNPVDWYKIKGRLEEYLK